MHDLNGILANGKTETRFYEELITKLSEKIMADANETSAILEGLKDNDLDRLECHRVLDAIAVSRDLDNGIERLVQSRLAMLNDRLKAVG